MASSVYSEVTSLSDSRYARDRVLDKLQIASEDLPYNVDDITISHNDFAIADVYNDSIRKLYRNYLFLIANAEIASTNTPVSAAAKFIAIQTDKTAALSAINNTPNKTGFGTTQSNSLSNLQETFITTNTDDSNKLLFFNYSNDDSYVYESDKDLTSLVTLLSGNEVEFNKTFKFKNVVSVDTIENILFVLDKGANTVYKFDITGLITNDIALKRTSVNDTVRPGRYLLKTIGGEGTAQTKNKLSRPNGLSVYNNRVYILDNGHNSVKVFDLDFNFLNEVSAPSLFNNPNYGELVSITVDRYSDTSDSVFGYILSKRGRVIKFDPVANSLSIFPSLYSFYDTRLNLLSATDLSNSFNKIVNSKVNKNIVYISNAGRIYKYYKSNFNTYMSELDLSTVGITLDPASNDRQEILSFDTTKINEQEYIAITTRYLGKNSDNAFNNEVSTHIFVDNHLTTKLYNENFYSNYFSLSNILVLPQEVVNNITFNKTTKKLIYNHYSLFENLNKKIYSFYNTTSGLAAYPTLSAIVPHEFTKPTELEENHNLYIGVNEPLLTDVINRPLKLLHSQQTALFDLIKEESLNSNPPSDYTVYLPGDQTAFPNVVKLDTLTKTVNAGEEFTITVSRVNVLTGAPACSFQYYTTLGTATSGDFNYIDSSDPSILTFPKGTNTVTITSFTDQVFSGGDKTFNIVLKENTNCVIDPENDTAVITITPIGEQFTVSLSGSTGTLEEGSTSRVQVIRTPNSGVNYITGADTSVNLEIVPTNIANSQYSPVVPLSTEYAVVTDKFADFANFGASQVSAVEIKNTSTITFTETITSVVFDLSAINNKESDSTSRSLSVRLSNPSDNASLGSTTIQDFLINDKFETISLHLSSISATYRADSHNATNQTLLSCVNIWEALSANSTFVANSATNSVLINFTINNPLSVFSVSTVSAAIQFEPDHALNFNNNKLNIIVEDDAALVGKGGRGGHGFMWASGSDLSIDNTGTDDVSAFTYTGEDGGPAIGSVNMTNYFNVVTIENSGEVYGGAGGGGGGVLGLSAEVMPNNVLSYLSAGCGGGGGRGLHLSGAGLAGLAAISEEEDDDGNVTFTQDTNFDDIYLDDGGAGTTTAGGSGGAFTASPGCVGLGTGSINITSFPAMSGLSGADFGNSGLIEDAPALPTIGTGSGFSTVSAEWAVRTGGLAGPIVNGTFTSVTSSGSGITKGNVLN